MKVLLLNQFFHPDISATAQLATDLAEDLAAAGFEVTALAARGAYLGGGKLPAAEVYRGVRIVRVPCTSLGKASIPRRLLDYGTFYAAAAVRAVTLGHFDVVVAMSTPPLVATLGALLATVRRRTRFVYWLQDVYPELAVHFGVMGERSLAARAFDRLSRFTLRTASAVVVLGEEMARRVRAKGVASERVHVIPNWADADEVRPIPPDRNAFRREHGLEGKRVVLYSGNMGRAHDLDTVVEAARQLRGQADLVFLFIGDGARRGEVEAAARELPSIRLLPYQPRERLTESLSAGDVHLVTQDAGTAGLIEPSKLYGVMAAGRPAVFIGPREAEAAQTILRERMGEVVENGNATAAAKAILQLVADPERPGGAARASFEREYTRRHRAQQFAGLLRAVL
jgi:glycosyltransferase involved in cell wall biosynthesis